jgi:hypothetical protein
MSIFCKLPQVPPDLPINCGAKKAVVVLVRKEGCFPRKEPGDESDAALLTTVENKSN